MLLAHEGVTNAEIARRVGCNVQTVRTWRRWHSEPSWRDAPRSGCPRRLTATEWAAITALACSSPREHNHPWQLWSGEKLAQVAVAEQLVTSISPSNCGLKTINTTADEEAQDTAGRESGGNTVAGITAYSCGGTDVYPTGLNSVWVGVVDKKAVAKPAPFYPLDAKVAQVSGTVAVSVLIDESGMVVWAQAISGHPLLRQPAMDAACYARFVPTLVVGPPLRASGVLTYDFVLK